MGAGKGPHGGMLVVNDLMKAHSVSSIWSVFAYFGMCDLHVDSFTVSLHIPYGRHLPAVRDVQGDCQQPLKNCGNFHWSHKPIMHCMWGGPRSIFWSANHWVRNTENRSHVLYPTEQSYCRQARTVKQSTLPAAASTEWGPNKMLTSSGQKWLPFCRRYFHMHFREWKVFYFD